MEWEINKGNPDSERRQLNRILDEVETNIGDITGVVASVSAGTGIDVDSTNPVIPVVALDAGSIASLALADSAIQAADLGTAAYEDTTAFAPAGTGTSAKFLRADNTESEELINTAGAQTFGLDGYGGHANFRGRRYNGTLGTPTALLSANLIFALSAAGYDGSNMSGAQARVSFLASENWSGTNRGTEISFATTPVGSAAMGTQFYMSSTNLRPSTNGTHTLGTSGLRWHEAYFDTGYTTTQAPLDSSTKVATTEYVDDAVAAGGGGGGGWTVVAKTATTTRTSTAVLADDPDLTIALTGGEVYLVRARIWFNTANATMDYQFAFAYTGTMPDMPRWAVSAGPGGVGAMTAGMSYTGTASNSFTVATSGPGYAYYDFCLAPTTSGNFTYQWAQRVSDAGNCDTRQGSYLEYRQIS